MHLQLLRSFLLVRTKDLFRRIYRISSINTGDERARQQSPLRVSKLQYYVIKMRVSQSLNRAPVSRVTGGDYHYTNEEDVGRITSIDILQHIIDMTDYSI